MNNQSFEEWSKSLESMDFDHYSLAIKEKIMESDLDDYSKRAFEACFEYVTKLYKAGKSLDVNLLKIHLEEVNGGNIWDILELSVDDSQKKFVADNKTSIIEAYAAITSGGHVFTFGIYDDKTPVGFVMIGFGTDEYWEDHPKIAENNYNIWRFMIDKRFQHKG